MPAQRPRPAPDRLTLLCALVALAGFWSPWLTHPAAALRLNGYDLSEWITRLPQVRASESPLSRLAFLFPAACLALLLAGAAARTRPGSRTRAPLAGIGWPLLLLAGLSLLAVLPPYPYVLTAYRDPEFQLQFFTALLAGLGLLVVLYLPAELAAGLQVLASLAGGVCAAWALLSVRPAASALLGAEWDIGLGAYLLLGGFAGLALAGLRRLLGTREAL